MKEIQDNVFRMFSECFMNCESQRRIEILDCLSDDFIYELARTLKIDFDVTSDTPTVKETIADLFDAWDTLKESFTGFCERVDVHMIPPKERK